MKDFCYGAIKGTKTLFVRIGCYFIEFVPICEPSGEGSKMAVDFCIKLVYTTVKAIIIDIGNNFVRNAVVNENKFKLRNGCSAFFYRCLDGLCQLCLGILAQKILHPARSTSRYAIILEPIRVGGSFYDDCIDSRKSLS